MTQPTPSAAKQALPVAVIVLAMTSIAALCVFVVVRAAAEDDRIAEINRDGISCIIEELNAHRVNSFNADQQDASHHGKQLMVPAPAPQPVPKELLKSCERFLTAK